MRLTVEIEDSDMYYALRELLVNMKLKIIDDPPLQLLKHSPQAILSTPAEDLKMPEVPHMATRARNVLKNASSREWNGGAMTNKMVFTIEDLCRIREKDFLVFRNAHKKTLAIVKEALGSLGLRFSMTDEDILAYRQGIFKLEGS